MRQSLKNAFEKIITELKKPKVRKYLIVGVWNSIFGYLCFVAIYYFFSKMVHYNVIIAVCNILAITNAFLFYKFVVFKSKGSFWGEYFRCYLVYGSSMLLNFLLFPVCFKVLLPFLYKRLGLLAFEATIPYVSQIAIMGITVVISYIGHNYFSFKKRSIIASE